jgi:hypothetical protein
MAFTGPQYYDPVWEVEVPQSRLANMAPECPFQGPAIAPIAPGDPGSFRMALRLYATENLHPTDAEERLALWRSLPKPHNVPSWMYLTCADPEDTKYFRKWKEVIKQDLGCDESSVAAFLELLRTKVDHAPEGGFMEGSRVLAHLFKDKQRGDNWDPAIYDQHNFSKYLMRSSKEATEALHAGMNVWSLQHDTTRSGSSSAWQASASAWQPNQGKGSSSSWQTSSSTWQPDQGKGTVKGKGKTVGKGVTQMGPIP